ncbi:translation initiation factor Sui1 [Novipirellula galeiformis]|uniref:Translation initiation factor Sui1 n=1 Tax=Novipirellula galeiformis TaxID=2528004 RepID=A0A5C6BYV4_9BACT|nr:translation initiation factor [Novipirellula galeiformis]TWU17115.1 translation initiation factor Sui1 [Novipirellula galeiformis]
MTRLFAGTPFDIPPTCDRCGELVEACQCPPPAHQYLPADKQTAKVFTEKRKNKRVMTIVKNLQPEETDLPKLLSELKSTIGAGGSLQADQIEIQGDHLARVQTKLKSIGYRVR